MTRSGALASVTLLVLAVAPPARATVYDVTIDTTGLQGFAGKLVLDFTGQRADNEVTILNFTTDGTPGMLETEGGLVQGSMVLGENPAPVTTVDDAFFLNRLAIPFTPFGSEIQFSLQLTESAASAGFGSFSAIFSGVCGVPDDQLPGREVCVRSSLGSLHTLAFSQWGPDGSDPAVTYDRDGMTVVLESENAFTDVVEGGATLSRPFGFGPLVSSFGVLDPSQVDFTFRCESCDEVSAAVPDEFSLFLQGPGGEPLFGTADPLGAEAAFAICIDGTPSGMRQVFEPTTLTDPMAIDLVAPALDSLGLQGTAAGDGGVSLEVSGVAIAFAPMTGQTAAEVLLALAATIHADPALQAQRVRAHVTGNLLVASGPITDAAVTDSGLEIASAIPAAPLAALLLLGAVLAITATLLARPRRD